MQYLNISHTLQCYYILLTWNKEFRKKKYTEKQIALKVYKTPNCINGIPLEVRSYFTPKTNNNEDAVS